MSCFFGFLVLTSKDIIHGNGKKILKTLATGLLALGTSSHGVERREHYKAILSDSKRARKLLKRISQELLHDGLSLNTQADKELDGG